jgi:hypothetical protein
LLLGHSHHNKHFFSLYQPLMMLRIALSCRIVLGYFFALIDRILDWHRGREGWAFVVVKFEVVAAGGKLLGLSVKKVHALNPETYDEVIANEELVR